MATISITALSALQIQGVASETFADGTLTISGATITAVTRVSVALSSVAVTGTRGQISFTATTPSVGNAIVVTGTNTGTSTGITAGTYYVIATSSTTTATSRLSASCFLILALNFIRSVETILVFVFGDSVT